MHAVTQIAIDIAKMINKQKLRLTLLLPLLPVLCGLALFIFDGRMEQALRNNLFDQYQRWHPRAYEDAPVRIVDIDDESLRQLGQWPWPRTRIAKLVDRVTAAGAASIAFDVVFAEPDRTSPASIAELWGLKGGLRDQLKSLPDQDAVLADSLAHADAVLGFAAQGSNRKISDLVQSQLAKQKTRFIYVGDSPARWFHGFGSAIMSLPQFEASAKGNGALNFVPDGDGVVRRVPLGLRVGQNTVPTMITEALRVAQGAMNVTLRSADENSGLSEIRIGDVVVPTTPFGEVWVHYTKPATERYIPAWKLLAGQIPDDQLAGKIILVGSSAQGLMDLRFNPFGIMPGVEAHAQALEQILTEHYLLRPGWARGAEVLALMIIGFVVGVLSLRARALAAALACVISIAAIFGMAWYAYIRHGVLLDAGTPSIGVLLTFILCSLWHHLSSEREQRWIKEAFARYVSPNRVAHLVEHPDDMSLGGRRQECSFIFTDLAGFTSLMETIDPAEAVALLNVYLDEMIAIAFRYEGTLDRIVGDAVAIMFSAPVPQPDHRARALACALEMDAFARRNSAALREKGIPFGITRIGVHSGEVIVGNFGGSNIFDYRALGDPVNTASRLESVNKHLGTRICVSDAILAGCPDIKVRPVGRLVLKGKTQALAVFEPIIEDAGPARAPLEDYMAALAAMQKDEPAAKQMFSELARAYPEDPLVSLHHRRLAAGERGDLIVMNDK